MKKETGKLWMIRRVKNSHNKSDSEQNRKSDASRRSLLHYGTSRF